MSDLAIHLSLCGSIREERERSCGWLHDHVSRVEWMNTRHHRMGWMSSIHYSQHLPDRHPYPGDILAQNILCEHRTMFCTFVS